LSILENNNGQLSLNDKSSPEEIYALLKMSKKAFKKAIGVLYKQRAIELTDKGIKLT
jgi:predicted RNA-binding protein (virulence factor B family)